MCGHESDGAGADEVRRTAAGTLANVAAVLLNIQREVEALREVVIEAAIAAGPEPVRDPGDHYAYAEPEA